MTEVEANRIFADQYGQTTNVDISKLGIGFLDTNFNVPTPRVRLGAEFTLPFTDLSFRAGYFRDPSVFKEALSEENKQFYSAGVGLLLDKSVRLDLAFRLPFSISRQA